MRPFIALRLFAMGLVVFAPLHAKLPTPPEQHPVLTAASRLPSSDCLTCHDGSGAPLVDRSTSHAYDVDYRDAQRQWGSSLRDASLPSGFGSTIEQDLLVDGRVECTTCHHTHQEQTENKFRLRIGGNTTPLCLACHNMEGR